MTRKNRVKQARVVRNVRKKMGGSTRKQFKKATEDIIDYPQKIKVPARYTETRTKYMFRKKIIYPVAILSPVGVYWLFNKLVAAIEMPSFLPIVLFALPALMLAFGLFFDISEKITNNQEFAYQTTMLSVFAIGYPLASLYFFSLLGIDMQILFISLLLYVVLNLLTPFSKFTVDIDSKLGFYSVCTLVYIAGVFASGWLVTNLFQKSLSASIAIQVLGFNLIAFLLAQFTSIIIEDEPEKFDSEGFIFACTMIYAAFILAVCVFEVILWITQALHPVFPRIF